MPNDPENQATSENTSLKVVLDFISKTSIPILLLIFMGPLLPEIWKLNISDFNLKSIEWGEIRMVFADNMAIINKERYDMGITVQKLSDRIKALEEGKKYSIPDTKDDVNQNKKTSNSKFSVLVFYSKNSPQAGNTARNITNKLLKEGFVSYSMKTDFSELRTVGESGTIRMVSTDKGNEVVGDIRNMIDINDKSIQYVSATSLYNGDMQIYIF